MRFTRKWSPLGYDRAVSLFENGYYDTTHFFRSIPGFLVQFGITYSKDENVKKLATRGIRDDPKLDPPIKFRPGIISYAGSGPNSRDSQLFISYGSATSLGRELWETPIGQIVKGMDNVEQFYGEYGDNGPLQHRIYQEGRTYIERDFPLLDSFLLCTVVRNNPAEKIQERKFLKEVNSKPFVENSVYKNVYLIMGIICFVIGFLLFKNRNKTGKRE